MESEDGTQQAPSNAHERGGGPRYCQVYNDPYRPALGDKHPASMGQPARECFPEIWFSSRLNFDDRYLHSCELVTSQIATAIANASELVAELTAMKRLHQLSTRLLHETELQPLLEEVLNATIALQSADFGNVQLYNPRTQTLEIVAQRGFGQDFLDHFGSVNESGAACGRALVKFQQRYVKSHRRSLQRQAICLAI